jgi:hypothetical protein
VTKVATEETSVQLFHRRTLVIEPANVIEVPVVPYGGIVTAMAGALGRNSHPDEFLGMFDLSSGWGAIWFSPACLGGNVCPEIDGSCVDVKIAVNGDLQVRLNGVGALVGAITVTNISKEAIVKAQKCLQAVHVHQERNSHIKPLIRRRPRWMSRTWSHPCSLFEP